MTTMSHERPPRHLGADQEGIDPSCRSTKMGVMQHHAAEAPVAG